MINLKTRIITSSRIIQARNLLSAHTGYMRNAYIILEYKLLKMILFKRCRLRWEDNIKMNHWKCRDGSDNIKSA
jgi:hypothetical protein